MNSSLVQERQQLTHDRYDSSVGLAQNYKQRDAFDYLRFVDRYLNGKLNILVKFRRRGINQEFLAIAQRESSGDGDVSLRESLRKLFGVEVERFLEWLSCEARSGRSSGYQQPMLVDFVKLVQAPENVISSLVWFEASDFVDSLFLSSLYFSVKSGLQLFGSRSLFEDWEISAGRKTLPTSGNQGAGHVVQCSSKVLNHVSGGGDERQGNRVSLRNDVNYLAGLEVWLSDDFIRVSTHEAVKQGTEILDVLFGPMDL